MIRHWAFTRSSLVKSSVEPRRASPRRRAYGGSTNAGRSERPSSTSSPTMRSPGCFIRIPRPMETSGLIRMRRCDDEGGTISWKTSAGGRRNCTITSVAVSGMCLPERIKIGTPDHRQVSISRRMAAKVSVSEPRWTPGVSRYPSYWPRTTLAGVSGRTALSSMALASRMESLSEPAGGSIQRFATNAKR